MSSTNPEPQPAVDKIAFRNALGAFVTGVTIVTTRDSQGNPVGLTANSFNSVSLTPPMVLWSLDLGAASLPAFREAKHWAVHILASGQEELSSRFAKRGTDKFVGLDITSGPDGVPLIDGCTARFICRTAFEYEGGDHAIFVGEVVAFESNQHIPLAFHKGRYARVLSPEAQAAAAPLAAGEEGQFGRHFLGHYLGRAHYELFDEIRREYRRRGLRGREYTVLTVLGIDDNCTAEELIFRAARGGVDVSLKTIEALQAKELLLLEGGNIRLSDAGRQMVVEFIAIAQASQQRVEDRLAPGEVALLKQLIERVIGPKP